MADHALLYDETLSHGARFLYLILWSYSDNKTRRCFPSRSTLARHMNVTTRTVDKYRAELEGAGLLSTEHQRAENSSITRNVYTLSAYTPLANIATPPMVEFTTPLVNIATPLVKNLLPPIAENSTLTRTIELEPFELEPFKKNQVNKTACKHAFELQVIALFGEFCSGFPQPRDPMKTKAGEKLLRAIGEITRERGLDLDGWRSYFAEVNQAAFIRSKGYGLDWFCNSVNFEKTIQGRYRQRADTARPAQAGLINMDGEGRHGYAQLLKESGRENDNGKVG